MGQDARECESACVSVCVHAHAGGEGWRVLILSRMVKESLQGVTFELRPMEPVPVRASRADPGEKLSRHKNSVCKGEGR